MSIGRDPVVDTAAGSDEPLTRHRRGAWWRRLAMLGLVAFLVAGLLGVWGVHDATVVASDRGVDLSVRYARTARPGITLPFDIELTKDGGWDGDTVRVAVSSDYLNALQVTNISPEPSSSTADGDYTVWEFDTPDADTLAVEVAAEVDPSTDPGRKRAVVQVRNDDGSSLTAVRFLTWVMP